MQTKNFMSNGQRKMFENDSIVQRCVCVCGGLPSKLVQYLFICLFEFNNVVVVDVTTGGPGQQPGHLTPRGVTIFASHWLISHILGLD